MSTLDDLRNTLDQHAHGLDDDAVADRADAVRGRVRVVRRRRAAAVVAAAAVAVAGVAVAVTDGARDIDPASDRTLVGQVAPSAMSSLGYVYEYASGQEGTDRLKLELAASDEPRLVSWATGSESQAVTYRLGDARPGRADVVDFGDFVRVPPGFRGSFLVEGDGDLGAAVYELSEGADPPAGHTERGITFREYVAGQTLSAADLGEPGQAELTVDAAATGRVRLAFLCTGGPGNAWTHYEISGLKGGAFGPSCSDDTADPGVGGMSIRIEKEAGGVRVRTWLTRGQDGPVVEDDDVLLGVGVYQLPRAAGRLAGQPVEEVIEHDGHRWRLLDVTSSEPGDTILEARGRDAGDTLVVGFFRRADGAYVQPLVDGRQRDFGYGTGTGSAEIGVLHGKDGSAGLRVRGDAPRVVLGLARYERVD